jgi:hypothetical protein
MTPTFLGGDLDFDSVSRHWWDRMDAAIADRQAHAKGPQVCLGGGGGGHSLCLGLQYQGSNIGMIDRGCVCWDRGIPVCKHMCDDTCWWNQAQGSKQS